MTEQVDAADPEPDGHLPGALGLLGCAQGPDEQRVQRGLRIVFGRQPGHALHHPGGVPQALEILAQPRERMRDVEVVDTEQITAAGVEEDQVAERQELERAAEPRPGAARGAGHATHPPEVPGVEGDEPVTLPERPSADDDAVRSPEAHELFRR